MLIWLIITVTLAFLGVFELILGFTIPFIELRVVLLFLLGFGKPAAQTAPVHAAMQ